MTGDHRLAQARRVVTGVNARGRSEIVIDELTRSRAATPGFTVLDIWRVESLPAGKSDEDQLSDEVTLAPPPHGLVYRLNVFPPDSEWDFAAGYEGSMDAIGAGDSMADRDHEIAGLHATDTIDVLTVISGEIYAVVEAGNAPSPGGLPGATRYETHVAKSE